MPPETRYHRQLTILPPDSTQTAITIIGAGGIGSVTGLTLAKLGFVNITMYDDDIVEDHNLPSQFFSPGQVGNSKVTAIADTIKTYTDIEINPVEHRFGLEDGERTEQSPETSFTPIMISAVDSMVVRAMIWTIMKERFDVPLYIDARMSAEKMRLYAINPADPDDQAFYEDQLYPDSQANEEACTAKAIAYNTFVIAGIIGSLVKKHVLNQHFPKEFIFDLDTYGLYKTPAPTTT